MGDSVSAYGEWMELYNDGASSEDLSGWTISTSDGKFLINLSKTIPSKGYMLLQHIKADATPSTESNILSYTGIYFNNSGGIVLVLKNGATEVQKIDTLEKWPAGDNTTKETMQWSGTEWITAVGTPKAVNSTINTEDAETTANISDEEDETSDAPSASAHTSPLPLSTFSEKQTLTISAGRERTVPAGNPVPFELYNSIAGASSLSAEWSFGDGGFAYGSVVSHTYEYPGDYIVVANVNNGGGYSVTRTVVHVFVPKISLRVENGAVVLGNLSGNELNIGGWKLQATGRTFILPKDTIVAKGKDIYLAENVTKITDPKEAIVYSPNNKIIGQAVPVIPVVPETKTVSVTPPEKNIFQITKEKSPIIAKKSVSATAVFSQSSVESKKETATSSAPQKIVLKKPEGFWSRFWKVFSR